MTEGVKPMIQHRLVTLAFALAVTTAWSASTGHAASSKKYFNLTSTAFKDGGKLPQKYSGNNPQNKNCDGQNVSPELSWSGAPAGTKSFALMLYDTAGRAPLGVVHWLAYDIPATKTSLKEGEATNPSSEFKGGKSTMGLQTYFGPCPPKGVKPHPYVFTAMALDLAPDALAPGLDQAALGAAVQGHLLESVSLVSRYGH
jgi:Raf kinase inhibitor-like YbhB/YbcL family protein